MPEMKNPAGGQASTGQEQENNHHYTNNSGPDLSSIILALGGRMQSDGSAIVHCPAHNDRNPSLHVTPADDGKILIHCLADCPPDAVIDALKARGLWPGKNGSSTTNDLPPGIYHKWHGAEYEDNYPYHTSEGQVIGYVVRYNRPDGKETIPFFKRDGSKWKAGAAPKPRPLYNQHILSRHPDKPVLIVEGEKATDAANRLMSGYVCMTWPGGSNAVGKADFKPLQGRDVVIWPDNDNPGHKAARNVAEQCRRAVAASVTTVKPPDGVKAGWDLADAEIEGWTGDQVQAWIEQSPLEPETSRRFSLVQLGKIEMRSPDWLIPGYIERDSLGLIFGDPESLKSFMAVGVASCVSTATDFHGETVKQGPVGYFAAEGQNGIKRRFMAWAIRHQINIDDAPIYLSTTPANLSDPDFVQEVLSAIQDLQQAVGDPVLIIIDTVARNFGPGDENSTQDMTRFISATDQIRAQTRATILLIHHSGHGDKSRARGAMALKGALDFEYRMTRTDNSVVMECTKQKDAPRPDPMAFEIRSVELGIDDENGDPITSAVLDRVDYTAGAAPKAGRGKWQVMALKILNELLSQHRENLESGGYDPDRARVSITDWRDACYDSGMDRRRWHKVKASLEQNHSVRVDHEYVTL